jgi:hypothetical protein
LIPVRVLLISVRVLLMLVRVLLIPVRALLIPVRVLLMSVRVLLIPVCVLLIPVCALCYQPSCHSCLHFAKIVKFVSVSIFLHRYKQTDNYHSTKNSPDIITIRVDPLCSMTGPNRLQCKAITDQSSNRVPFTFYNTVPSDDHNHPQQTDSIQELKLLR